MKVLHLADLHLGVENYGRLDPATGLNTRLTDFLRCLDFALAHALEAVVDLVVFAGDIYRSREPNPTVQREFAARIHRLSRGGISVVIVVGNHDLPSMSAKATSVSVFSALEVPGVWVSREPELLQVKTRAGLVQIVTLPALLPGALVSPEERGGLGLQQLQQLQVDRIGERIAQLAAQLDRSRLSMLVAHASVKGARVGSEANLLTGPELILPPAMLSTPAFDYVALGHVHKHQRLGNSQPPLVYAGSIDRVDFGEENEEKGFALVSLAKGASDCEFVPTPARAFRTIRVDVSGADGTAQVLSEIARHEVEGAVVRVIASMSEEVPIDESAARKALHAADCVCPIVREITNPRAPVRLPGLAERATDPLAALEEYFEAKHLSDSLRRDMREYAGLLLRELTDEEQLGLPQ